MRASLSEPGSGGYTERARSGNAGWEKQAVRAREDASTPARNVIDGENHTRSPTAAFTRQSRGNRIGIVSLRPLGKSRAAHSWRASQRAMIRGGSQSDTLASSLSDSLSLFFLPFSFHSRICNRMAALRRDAQWKSWGFCSALWAICFAYSALDSATPALRYASLLPFTSVLRERFSVRFEIAPNPRSYTTAGPGRRTGCGSPIEIKNQQEQPGPLSFVCINFVSRAGLPPTRKGKRSSSIASWRRLVRI